jgi:hypothetical protein
MFHLFQTYVASIFYLDIGYVSHLCCKNLFEIFWMFQSYVAISVFMLQFVSVLSVYYIRFTHKLQLYVSNVSSVLVVCCIQVFHVSEVESPRGHGLGAGGWGTVVGVHNTPRILQTGNARRQAGSLVPPA